MSPGTTGTRSLGGLCGAQQSPTSERISTAQGAPPPREWFLRSTDTCLQATGGLATRPREPLICPDGVTCEQATGNDSLTFSWPEDSHAAYPWKPSDACGRDHTKELSTCTASWHQ